MDNIENLKGSKGQQDSDVQKARRKLEESKGKGGAWRWCVLAKEGFWEVCINFCLLKE